MNGRLEFFRTWLLEDPSTRVAVTFAVLGLLLVLPLIGFAAYLWRMKARTIAERTFPPAGYAVVGKRQVVTGDEAIRYARLLRVMAVLLLVAAVAAVIQLWRFWLLLPPST